MAHGRQLLFLVLGILIILNSVHSETDIKNQRMVNPNLRSKLTYDDHIPIIIVGDDGFESMATSEEWEGDGSELSPYIIENYNISDKGICIGLTDVSSYFIIRDCFLNTTDEIAKEDSGIVFDNVTHGRIENCIILFKKIGMHFFESHYNTISNCKVNESNIDAFFFDKSNNNGIEHTQVCENGGNGLTLERANYTSIFNTTFYSNDGHAIEIDYSANFEAKNCTIEEHGNDGVRVYESSDIAINDTKINNNGYGIYFENVNPSNVSLSTITNSDLEGFVIYSSNHCTVIHNDLYANGGEPCEIHASESDYLHIIGNTIHDNEVSSGVRLESCDHSNLTSNEIYNNNGDGVQITGSEFCFMKNNTICENDGNGVWMEASNYATITNNTINDNYQTGFLLENSDDCDFIENTFFHNSEAVLAECGLHIQLSDRIEVIGNIIHDDYAEGVYFFISYSGVITNNRIYSNDLHGIHIEESENCSVKDNIIFDNDHSGLWIDVSDRCVIENNTIFNNERAIWQYMSDFCNITDNTFNGTHDDIFVMRQSNYTRITHNVLKSSLGYGIDAELSNITYVFNNTMQGHYSNAIWADGSHNWTILENDIIDNQGDALAFYLSDNITIMHNEISNNSAMGVNLDDCNLIFIHNNEIFNNSDIGIYVEPGTNLSILDNMIYNNAWPDDEGSGIYLEDVFTAIVDNNTVFHSGYHGMYIHTSNWVNITDCTIYSNVGSGMDLYQCHNSWFVNNEIFNSTWDGIHIGQCENFTMKSNTIYDNGWLGEAYPQGSGIRAWHCSHSKFIDNTIYNNSVDGIELEYSDFITITKNTIYGNLGKARLECGISIHDSDEIVVDANRIYNNSEHGLYLQYTDRINMTNNMIYNNTLDGVYADQDSSDCIFRNNTIYDNGRDGLYACEANNWNITWNIIFDNEGYGLNMSFCSGCYLYYNDIGWNTLGNAWTNTDTNYWDNEIGIGNWWSDYNYSGSYDVQADIDYHPWISLAAGIASDITYEIATIDNTLAWNATALNPWKYEVLKDNVEYATDAWDGSDVEIDVDGFDVGYYNITLIVYHISGHWDGSYAFVNVTDFTAPTWDIEPSNQIVELGSPFVYDVDATDPSDIDQWWLNTTLFAIDENGVITNATTLSLGIYLIKVSVNDTQGNIITASFMVTVEDTTPPSFEAVPEDIQYEEGEIGYNIIWIVFDYCPGTYEILLNGSLIISGQWNSTTTNFTLSVDGLLPNVYNYTLVIKDCSNNSVSDFVLVTVTELVVTTTTTSSTTTTTSLTNTTTTTTDLFDTQTMILIIGGVGGAIAIIIIIIVIRKRKSS